MYQTYIDNYNSNDFKEYLELNRKISDYRIKIRNSDKDKNFYFNEDKNNISIKYKKVKVDIKKPIYKSVFNEINKLKNEKKNLLQDYEILKDKIINEINSEKDFTKYDNIIKKLTKIDEDIEDLVEYHNKINSIVKTNLDKNISKLNEIKSEIKNINKKFLVVNDDIEKKNLTRDYLKLEKEKQNLEGNYFNDIDYIVYQIPSIKYSSNTKKIEEKKKKPDKVNKTTKTDKEIEDEKRYKLKEKISKKNPKTKEEAVEKLNKLEKKYKEKFMNEFNFSNIKECKSSSYRESYFMKKPEILKIIKKYPDIKNILPKNYPTLTKDKLCDEIYKL
tara:strand:- start:1259 stop:2254 length:996 start_codon:yes stop_codon:yes gene_type:complete